MKVTASRLRQDIYRILDQVLESGTPVEIERRGKVLRIVPPQESSRTGRLKQRNYLKADPESLVSIDWTGEWKP